jgi:XTP/dITP diphosphohydrolase/tetrapyrrole methylase family protein/MazG family protein/ATP diphosphatase
MAAVVTAGRVDVRAPEPLLRMLVAAGVDPDPGAPTIAAPDRDAWRLAAEDPSLRTLPSRAVLEGRAAAAALAELWAVTARLRRECPWDREQTPETIVAHTVEEAYEVADAALSGPPGPKLVDELGDLLFQTYFLALLAREAGAGDLAGVADGIREKLVRRHPHVFGEVEADTSAAVVRNWEEIKRTDEGREGIFHDVPGSLPALLAARKLQRRAAAVGFDWESWPGAWPSLVEETAELRAALDADAPDAVIRHEAGDLLFAAVNVLRLAGIDPELALRGAGARFQQRVDGAEALAAADGLDFRVLGLDEQDGYYRRAKRDLEAEPRQ